MRREVAGRSRNGKEALAGWAVVRAVAAFALVVLLAGCVSGSKPGTPGQAAEPGSEGAVLTGRVTAAQPEVSLPLAVQAGHQRLAVVLVLTTNLPADALSLNVSGPGGRQTQVRVSPELYVLPSNNPTIAFDSPAGGDWTAKVRLASGAVADYEVSWCADDAAHPGPATNKACHRTY